MELRILQFKDLNFKVLNFNIYITLLWNWKITNRIKPIDIILDCIYFISNILKIIEIKLKYLMIINESSIAH